MCGLVGLMTSNAFLKHKEALANLLFLDTLRGRDSTGVAAIRKNADTDVLKSTVPGCEFVEGPRLFEHLKLTDFLWIGHNRFGTVGKNVKTNAHPFTVDDEDGCCMLVGAHNGTLKNKHVLTDHNTFGTDSEALYNSIATEGLEETISRVEGAWALTWYDHLEEEFRVLRNKERPLFYAYSDDKKTMFWASEIWMIRVATSRAGFKLFEDAIYNFEEDTLYTFAAPEANAEIKLTKKQGGLVGKTQTFFQTTTGGATGSTSQTPLTGNYARSGNRLPDGYEKGKIYNHATRRWEWPVNGQNPLKTLTSQSGTTTSDTGAKPHQSNETGSTKPPNVGTAGNVLVLPHAKTYRGYRGVPLTLAELKEQLSDPCAWCELEMIDVRDRFGWLATSQPVCAKCIDGTPDQPTEAFNSEPKTQTIH